jgi:hypothetical protein
MLRERQQRLERQELLQTPQKDVVAFNSDWYDKFDSDEDRWLIV